MATFSQPLPVELHDRIAELVDRALATTTGGYPPDVLADERAVQVYSTSAMYVYYLADDGAAYELDLDSVRSAGLVTNPTAIREVYERAIERWPELAGLLAVAIVERVSPGVAMLESFHAGVEPWNPAAETREAATRRCLDYFASRLDATDGYVVQWLPTPHSHTSTLELVGTEPALELELHVWTRGGTRVETLHRGTRASIVTLLRSPELPATILALDGMIAPV